MKITEVLSKDKPTLSFEFFPPKTSEQEKRLFEVLGQLKACRPDFVSVTYGAMGTTREKTLFWVGQIKSKYGIEPVAHLTCVAATKDEISRQLDELENAEVENILALRGDPPEGQADFVPPADGFRLAKELIAFIRRKKPEFSLGCAGFPEGHPRAPSLDQDTQYLKQKIEAGAEYVITQLFFDNHYYFDFVARCRKAGIAVPIIPGLMPITSLQQVQKMTQVCGATIPQPLRSRLEKHQDDPSALRKIGAEYTLVQALELSKAHVPGIHFFVMNQAEPIATILKELKLS